MCKKIQKHRAFIGKKIMMYEHEKKEILQLADKLGVTARDLLECAVYEALYNSDGTLKATSTYKQP